MLNDLLDIRARVGELCLGAALLFSSYVLWESARRIIVDALDPKAVHVK